jgi:hypothetical protein
MSVSMAMMFRCSKRLKSAAQGLYGDDQSMPGLPPFAWLSSQGHYVVIVTLAAQVCSMTP